VRTRPPQGYDKTIANYLAFRIRGPQKDAEINIGAPEPSACALDEFINSSRGWVVPVVYATRTGVPSGKETINIVTRQYFFWFRGDAIAGLTPRIDVCPGAALTEFPQSTPVADAAPATAGSQAKTEASVREGAAATEAAKAASAPKRASANKAKKTSGASAAASKPAN
jgi:hypothetical protein